MGTSCGRSADDSGLSVLFPTENLNLFLSEAVNLKQTRARGPALLFHSHINRQKLALPLFV